MLWVKRFLAALLLGIPLAGPAYAAAGPPFQLPTSYAFPSAIITGSDHNLWFAESGKIGRISTTGSLSDFSLPSGRSAKSLAFGPNGNLWFTEPSSGRVGEMTQTGGLVNEYLLPGNRGYGTPINRPQSIVNAPDGHLWITQTVFSRQSLRTVGSNIDRIDGVNRDGTLALTQFSLPSGGTKSTTPAVDEIVVGSDGALWFTDTQQGKVWQKTTTGNQLTSLTLLHGSPAGIAAGPDKALWVTATYFGPQGNRLIRIAIDGTQREYTVPADGQNGATLARIASAGGNLWFADYDMTTSSGNIFRATTAGGLTTVHFPTYMEIDGLTAGPDGALWFGRTDNQTGTSFIDRIGAG